MQVEEGAELAADAELAALSPSPSPAPAPAAAAAQPSPVPAPAALAAPAERLASKVVVPSPGVYDPRCAAQCRGISWHGLLACPACSLARPPTATLPCSPAMPPPCRQPVFSAARCAS